ncbi:hypothetical protein PMAYCL1PPCAC_11843 [Pristionchus mayeri]|uniref:Uncharacterized protein n=1 Tax=Pristionchus mayeri TaxID=1317129 RepID=A0AAN4ZI30_9BILA|nr:hypothetical protein PMAYCL1PPCAC_11843 [Pristionchus mayeri]
MLLPCFIPLVFARPLDLLLLLNSTVVDYEDSPSNLTTIPFNSSSGIINSTSAAEKSTSQELTKSFDVSRLIRVRADDWRDEQPKNDIIWSHESRYHPEFGKMVARVGSENDRVGRSSQLMSFVILGSVIGFILYTYLSHVIFVRKLRRELERAQLRHLIHSSALIMAHSAHHVRDFEGLGERRRSILNMFRAFKL